MIQPVWRGMGIVSLLCSLVILVDIQGSNPSAFAASLGDVYAMAKENDPQFQSVKYDKLAVEERRNQAIAEFLPVISGSADYTQTFQDIESSDNSVVAEGSIDYGSTTFALHLQQPIFNWESYLGLDKSDKEILQVEVGYTLAEQDLIIRVAERYFGALEAQDQSNLIMAEMAAVDKHYELASGRFDMGLIPITDLHDAKARKADIMARSIEAENILDDAMQALEEITGSTVQAIEVLKPEIELTGPVPQDIAPWLDRALKENPAIVQQRYAVEVAGLNVDLQRAEHYPTVDLVGSFESKDTNGSIYGGGSDGEVADLMLVLNVPFYEGGAVRSKVREARHVLSSVRQELVRQERAVEREARAAYSGVNSALGQVEALQQSVISNQLALEAKQEGFMSGLYTSLNVLDAERDLSFANIDYARARYEYLLNNLRLKQAVGSLNENDLILLDNWLQ